MSLLGKVNRFMINIEYRIPVNKLFGITIFADGGLLSNDFINVAINSIKWNNGLGLAIQTPLGPARIDYAFQSRQPGNLENSIRSARIYFESYETRNFFNIEKTNAFGL